MSNIASRYRNTNIISGSFYSTYDFPDINIDTISTFNIRSSTTDRLDTLASKYLGSGEYWWIIAMVNNIDWAFDFIPGEILRIPADVQEILKYL